MEFAYGVIALEVWLLLFTFGYYGARRPAVPWWASDMFMFTGYVPLLVMIQAGGVAAIVAPMLMHETRFTWVSVSAIAASAAITAPLFLWLRSYGRRRMSQASVRPFPEPRPLPSGPRDLPRAA
ncbi:MAG: hypothetical protein H6983_15085 [Ectothiorhodospiraceae bacterium]|nr:hypothetical protein [Chromatiales bacterium]MCP5155493.1 hypothetical protein [Ectothiorhodospiraceae bacterium]